MMYREITAVCSQIHTQYTSALCGQNVELLNVKLVVRIVTTGFIIGKFILSIPESFQRKESLELCIKIQSAPRSKHIPCR